MRRELVEMNYKWTKKIVLAIFVFTFIVIGGCGTAGKRGNVDSKKGIMGEKSSIELQKNSVQNNIANADAHKNSVEGNTTAGKNSVSNYDSDRIQEKRSLAKTVSTKSNNTGIPVLMYHSVMYEKGNQLRIPKEKFYDQMKYLKDNEYTTLTLDELYNFLVNNKLVPEKSIVITFDDGYVDNYTNAYPVLKEFGFKATIFVITCTVDTNSSYLTSSQLKELEANGIQIEGHTVRHVELNKLSYAAQLKTLKDSKKLLDELLHKDVKYMAYPSGKYNEDTIKAAKESGYKMALTTMGGWADKSDGILTLNRVYISSLASVEDFKYRITHPNYNKQ